MLAWCRSAPGRSLRSTTLRLTFVSYEVWGGAMDPYDEAVATAATADVTIRWVKPVKAFGYVVLTVAAIAGILAFVALITVAAAGFPFGPTFVLGLGLLAFALIGFLQASAVLMVASYVQMKSQEVSYRVAHLLSEDD